MHEVKEKNILDLVSTLDWLGIGGLVPNMCPQDGREKKGGWNFSRMRRNFVFCFAFLFLLMGGFSFLLAYITHCGQPARLSNGYLGMYSAPGN